MELLKAYLKERRLTLAAFLLFVGVFAVSFALYGLPLAAVGYPAGLCVLLGACLAAWDYGRAARRHKALKRLREAGEAVLLDLPAMTTVEGADCAAVVETLNALHAHSDSVFSDAITTVLHDAMEPEYL